MVNKLIELSRKCGELLPEEEESIESIGTIVVDELHMIGDESRGYLLEVMLSKIRYLSSVEPKFNIQLIAMSATLPNLREIAIWLDASLYVTSFRPVEVKEYMKIGNDLIPLQGTTMDPKIPVA